MKIEEIAFQYADDNYQNYQEHQIHSALATAYLAGATEDKWVTLSRPEDYPPNGKLVLVRDTRDVLFIDIWIIDTWGNHLGNAITHWHPLPSLPPTGNKSL